jgi:hypothetical protein
LIEQKIKQSEATAEAKLHAAAMAQQNMQMMAAS